jgi:hypothetical protein
MASKSAADTTATTTTTTGPSDKAMEAAVVSTLGASKDALRPNKLRKLVCKQLQGATWTQFATCLDEMVDKAVVQRKTNNGEVFVQMVVGTAHPGDKKKGKSKITKKKDTKSTAETEEERQVLKEEVRIPRSIALYLLKKKHLKLKNIQTNTKTKLTIFGKLDTGTKHTVESLAELHTLQITAEFVESTHAEEEVDLDDGVDVLPKETREAAEKHIAFAKKLIQKIVNAQKLNPDRFAPKQFGGTFEEQAKREAQKRRRVTEIDYRSQAREEGETEKHTRRKREKFY